MSVHTYHPSIREHGLQDDCPRCAEHAEHPAATLDDENLRALIVRTQAWMRDEEFPRSETETVAMRKVEQTIRFAQAMERVLPKALA
jgi:hypothetical protein